MRTRAGLELIIILVVAVLLYLWSIFIFYPIVYWWGNLDGRDYWIQERWVIAFITGAIAIITYFIIRFGNNSERAVRKIARSCSVTLLTFTLLSILFLAIPFFSAGGVLDPYHDPSTVAPYSWGEVSDPIYSFMLYFICPWGPHLAGMSITVLVLSLLLNRHNFTRSERLFNWSTVFTCGASFILLLPVWPTMMYWLTD